LKTESKAIVLNLEEDNIGAVLLVPLKEINEGDKVKRTGKIASLGVGEGLFRKSKYHLQVSHSMVRAR